MSKGGDWLRSQMKDAKREVSEWNDRKRETIRAEVSTRVSDSGRISWSTKAYKKATETSYPKKGS